MYRYNYFIFTASRIYAALPIYLQSALCNIFFTLIFTLGAYSMMGFIECGNYKGEENKASTDCSVSLATICFILFIIFTGFFVLVIYDGYLLFRESVNIPIHEIKNIKKKKKNKKFHKEKKNSKQKSKTTKSQNKNENQIDFENGNEFRSPRVVDPSRRGGMRLIKSQLRN